jgi:TRAP-type C4-dicarboxylate transport system substrate-binding protein
MIRILPLLALTIATTAYAGDGTIVIKGASVAPAGTPWAKWTKRVSKRIVKQAKQQGLKVKYKFYLSGRLGGEKETVEECRLGRLATTGVSMGAIATAVPAFNVFELPFLFRSDAEADYILDEVVFDQMSKMLNKAGFVLLSVTENGWHGMGTQGSPILKASDFKGRKLRVQQSRVHLETFKALGASPVEMGVPEVLSALQNKVVDGFTNTPLFTFATNWYRAIQHYSVTRHIYQPALLVASKKWYDKLPKKLQTILTDSKHRLKETKLSRKWIRAMNEPLLAQFGANQIKVHKPSQAEIAKMAAQAKVVHNKFRKFGGKDGAMLLDMIEKGLKKYRSK